MDRSLRAPHDRAPADRDAQRKHDALAATQSLGGGIDDDPDEFPALLAEVRHRRSTLDLQSLPEAQRSEQATEDIIADDRGEMDT